MSGTAVLERTNVRPDGAGHVVLPDGTAIADGCVDAAPLCRPRQSRNATRPPPSSQGVGMPATLGGIDGPGVLILARE